MEKIEYAHINQEIKIIDEPIFVVVNIVKGGVTALDQYFSNENKEIFAFSKYTEEYLSDLEVDWVVVDMKFLDLELEESWDGLKRTMITLEEFNTLIDEANTVIEREEIKNHGVVAKSVTKRVATKPKTTTKKKPVVKPKKKVAKKVVKKVAKPVMDEMESSLIAVVNTEDVIKEIEIENVDKET